MGISQSLNDVSQDLYSQLVSSDTSFIAVPQVNTIYENLDDAVEYLCQSFKQATEADPADPLASIICGCWVEPSIIDCRATLPSPRLRDELSRAQSMVRKAILHHQVAPAYNVGLYAYEGSVVGAGYQFAICLLLYKTRTDHPTVQDGVALVMTDQFGTYAKHRGSESQLKIHHPSVNNRNGLCTVELTLDAYTHVAARIEQRLKDRAINTTITYETTTQSFVCDYT